MCNNRPRTDRIIFGDEAEISVMLMKTGYVCLREGSVFDDKIKEKWYFVLGIINGIIMPKTNKF